MDDGDPRGTTPSRALRIVRLVMLGTVLAVLVALPFPILMDLGLRRALTVIALAVGAIGWVLELRRPRLGPEILLAIGAVVVITVASAWASDYPSFAWPAAWLTVAYGGIALLVWRWLLGEAARREALVVVGVGGLLLVAGSYLAAAGGAYGTWLGLGMAVSDLPLRPAAVGGIVSGPLWTSEYLGLLGPLALAAPFALGRSPRTRRAVGFALVILLLVGGAVFISAVRAIWLATAIVVMLVVADGWLHGHLSRHGGGPRRLALTTVAVLVAIVVAGLLIGRLDSLGVVLRDFDEGRTSAWRAALALGSGHPWLGVGPGAYATARFSQPAESGSVQTLLDPHNGIMAAFSQTGILGLVAVALVVAVVASTAWRTVHGEDRRASLVAVAASAGLGIVALHRMLDIVFMLPGVMVCSIIVAGLAMGPSAAGSSRWATARWRSAASAVAIAAVVITLASLPRWIAVESGRDDYRLAATAWANGDELEATIGVGTALGDAPDLVPAHHLKAMLDLRAGRLDDAIRAATTVAEREPLRQNLTRLGMILAASGRTAEAWEVLDLAASGDPPDAVASLNAAMAGTPDRRAAALQRLLAIDPDMARHLSSLGLDAGESRTAVDATAARLLADGAADQAVHLALMADRPDLASRAASTLDGDHRQAVEAAIRAWSGDAEAVATLNGIAAAAPAAADALAWLVAVHDCRSDDAERWADVIRIRVGAEPTTIVAVGTAPALIRSDHPVRYPTWVWGELDLVPAYPDGMWTIDRRAGVTCLS